MSTVPVPQVKWLAFVLFREQAMLEAVLPRLEERFSGVDFRGAGLPPIQRSLLQMVRRETEMLARLNDPNGVYALCDCEVE